MLGPWPQAVRARHGRIADGLGRQFDVRFVLDGSVCSRGDDLRVTSRSFDSRTARNWAETHRLRRRGFQATDEVAASIAATIGREWGSIARETQRLAPAERAIYEAMLQEDRWLRQFTRESLADALAALQRAEPDSEAEVRCIQSYAHFLRREHCLHPIPAVHAYARGRYEDALAEAERCHTDAFPWSPLCRAAAPGQLGRTAEAADEMQRLLVLVPDFRTRGPELLRRNLYRERSVKARLAGLDKAGAALSSRGRMSSRVSVSSL